MIVHEENLYAITAESMGALFILSTVASAPMEDVTASSPNGLKWFQLFVMADRDWTESLIRRAENAGLAHYQEKPAATGTRSLSTNAGSVDAGLSWITQLLLILKGIVTAEDVQLAVQRGAAGIKVSNHGARTLDGLPATIDVLPEIIHAVDGHCEVYLDGGITHGSDIFKALALGARMVVAA
ncbi:unnamed protein product [Darwinula stevensoni]|uniref:FMN hydroxy acid dehydrogenase domain-containing protein n=1 Tax=Darwinula stevensoni TaxID=69355 RepID=A0A7R8XAK0_9CRUS|nr:unnamed protein product [Darwinula stevensoni]CAG0890340.1 unnamed protein product [Darwinula stevensoni]